LIGDAGLQPGWPIAAEFSGVVRADDLAGAADGVVVRVAGLGEVCALVQAADMSMLAQTTTMRFMTIE
jgi:hypothetical protein